MENTLATKKSFSLLQGGGEMGKLIRQYDWASTSIGSPEYWPQSLRTTLGILLHSAFPMFLFWDKELICFYNDAFRPSLGNEGKHPAIGKKGKEVWPEIWEFIGPLIDKVKATSEPVWFEDQLVPFYRNGKIENIYWTFSYSPAYGDNGEINGVFVTCTETTKTVVALQKLQLSDDRFQNLVREASVGIVVLTGEEMRVDIVNEAYGRLINLTPVEMIGKPLFNLIPDAELLFYPLLNNVRLTGEPLYLYAHPYSVVVNGKEVEGYLDIVYQAYKESDGTISGVMVLCHDVTEGELAHKKIEQVKMDLQNAIDIADLGTFKIDVATNTGTYTENIRDWFGLDKLDNQMEVIAGKVHAEDKQNVLDALANSIQSQEASRHDLTYKISSPKDGSVRHLHSIGKVLFEGDKPVSISGVIQDVTPQVEADKRVKDSEQNLRNIILQAPVAMCILRGPEYVIDIANERMFELWGKQPEDVTGKLLFDGVPEAKGQGFEALLHSVYHTGETIKLSGVSAMLPRQSGLETIYIDLVYEAFREGGAITGIMVVATEVTEQVVARKKMEESEEGLKRFKFMADNSKDFVGMCTLEGMPLYLNAAGMKLVGLESCEEMMQKKLREYFFPADAAFIENEFMPFVLKEGFAEKEIRFKHFKTGEAIWMLYNLSVLYNSSHEPHCFATISKNITEQKLFEEELSRQVEEKTAQIVAKNSELQNMNNELEQFTYAASHDMQEPLRKVQTFSSFLLDNNSGQLDERGKIYLSKIEASVNRMQTIVHDLLIYSHQTREEQEFEPTDLNKLIEEVEADLELLIQQKAAIIIKDVLPQITAVPSQMNQLFFNLFSNALKFSKPGVPVQINVKNTPVSAEEAASIKGLQLNQEYIKIIFADNGIGFKQEYAEQIFSLFKRLHGKSEYEGTGIGLGLCKKIVQNHQGTIWAESEVGNGARFYIVLPVYSILNQIKNNSYE